MTQLSDYFARFEHISAVTPMTLDIEGKKYDACSYIARFPTPEGSQAYQRGERHYWRSFVYCLGELPACYRRNTHTTFLFEGDPADWYIACYWPQMHHHRQDTSVPSGEHQPFGANFFLLAPWEAKDPIDQYERKPYRRVRVQMGKQP